RETAVRALVGASELLEPADELGQLAAGYAARLGSHLDARPDGRLLDEELRERRLVLDGALLLALLDAIERRLAEVQVAAVDELLVVPVEEREQERADVAAVDVGVGQHDDAVVPQLREVEVLVD